MSRLASWGMVAVLAFGALVHQQPQYRLADHSAQLYHVAVVGDSYTTGTNIGGLGTKSWTSRTWQALNSKRPTVTADVAAEGRAGYGVRGDHGSIFSDLTSRIVRPDDQLIVFFGSRNDQEADLATLGDSMRAAFDIARRVAPGAKLLVIGPPWPTADVPQAVLEIRDTLYSEARAVGAQWVDPLAEKWFVGRPDLIGRDGVHPTDAGHAYMADKIIPLINPKGSTIV